MQFRELVLNRKVDLSDPGLISIRYPCLRLEMKDNPRRYNNYFELLSEDGQRLVWRNNTILFNAGRTWFRIDTGVVSDARCILSSETL